MVAVARGPDRNTTGRWLLGVGALLIGAAAWCLFAVDDDAGTEFATAPDAEDDAHAAPMRTTDGASDDIAPAQGPALVGHTPKPAGPVLHATVTVRVVGVQARPLVGVRVDLVPVTAVAHPASPASQSEVTDAHGEAVFTDVPLDGTDAARLMVDATSGSLTFSPDGRGRMVITRGRALQVGSWMPIRRAHVTLASRRGIRMRIEPRRIGDDQPVVMTVEELLPCVVAATAQPRRTDEDLLVAVSPARSYTVEFALRRGDDPPISSSHSGRLHPQATSLLARAPVLEDARVVLLLDEVPEEVRGKPITWTRIRGASGHGPVRVHADALGRHHVAGIPHEVGEIVTVMGRVGRYTLGASGILGFDPQDVLVLRASFTRGAKEIVLPKWQRALQGRSFREVAALHMALHELRGSRTEARLVSLNSFVVLSSSGGGGLANLDDFLKRAPARTPPAFHVRCSLPSGEPAAGALVTLPGGGREVYADSLGVARLKGVSPGRCTAKVWGAGAPQEVSFHVPASRTGTIDVRGTVGGTVDVEVVDAQGRALPFAEITIKQPCGLPWADLDCSAPKGGEVVQRIDPYVDSRGRRRCYGVQPGYVTITATYGTRQVPLTVKVLDGRTVGARMVLPVLTLKPAPKPKSEAKEEAADER